MEVLTLIISIVCLIVAVIVLVKLSKSDKNNEEITTLNENFTKFDGEISKLDDKIKEMQIKIEAFSNSSATQFSAQREEIQKSVLNLGNNLREEQKAQQQMVGESLKNLENSFENIRKSVVLSINNMREENKKSLDEINGTVNEKLQKTLDDKISKSFETVNKRLAEVYEGLGEMKNVASGVSDLKKVLSNVKTRGIMGEIQLGAILEEILTHEQYAEQVSVVPNSSEKVDFAVKLPNSDNSDIVYLPIDSKFPGDSYANLMEAYESGNTDEIKQKRTILENEIKRCAKSIRDKYVKPPYTTDFAIMFLPFEGLYAEVINMGLVEKLQADFRVNITGPSTMGAMLNSLHMGFRTLAIQKKSGEVWKILEACKTEFLNFEKVLENTRNRLRQADDELDKLIGTRTKAINRKLKEVGTLTDSESSGEILEIE